MVRRATPRPKGDDLTGMADRPIRHAMPRCATVFAAVLLLSPATAALAQPLLDSLGGGSDSSGVGTPGGSGTSDTGTAGGNGSSLAGTQDLTAGEAQDLRSQLSLVNGISAPTGGGWTFVPSLTLQEEFTDNVLEAHAPRRWDLGNFISPGFALAGDLPRLTATVTYSPTLSFYDRDGDLNALTQQLNALGHLTLDPNLAYVDVTALAGVTNAIAGLGNGTVGASAQAGGQVNTGLGTNGQGLTRNNENQVVSFSLAPYLQRDFGDYGTGKLGYTANVSRSSALTGFASLPLPTGGQNASTLFSNQEIATYNTGNWLGQFQNTVSVNLTQSQQTNDAGSLNGFTGQIQSASTSTNSTQTVFTDEISYQVNRTIQVFVSGGHEDIDFGGVGANKVNDLTWSFGTTLTPNPDSSLTVSYGHSNGFNSFQANGHYQATARTLLTVSYSSQLGTQLQFFQQAVNAVQVTPTGQFVTTNGAPVFVTINQLAQQDSVFRTDAFVLGSSTSWDRDVLSLSLQMTSQTIVGAGNAGTPTSSKSVIGGWTHEMRPDMLLSTTLSYTREEGNNAGIFLGDFDAYNANLAWRYQLSQTVNLSVSYSFFDRISPVSTSNVYQSLFLVGLTKTF